MIVEDNNILLDREEVAVRLGYAGESGVRKLHKRHADLLLTGVVDTRLPGFKLVRNKIYYNVEAAIMFKSVLAAENDGHVPMPKEVAVPLHWVFDCLVG